MNQTYHDKFPSKSGAYIDNHDTKFTWVCHANETWEQAASVEQEGVQYERVINQINNELIPQLEGVGYTYSRKENLFKACGTVGIAIQFLLFVVH